MIDVSTRRRPRESAVDRTLVGIALAAVIVSAWSALQARAELRHARDVVVAAERDTSSAEARLRLLDSKRPGELERIAARLETTNGAPPPRVLADLAALLPANVRLASLSLAYGEGVTIEAQVAARNAAAYDAFLDNLVQSKRFTGIEPGDEAREGEVQARVRMTWREAP